MAITVPENPPENLRVLEKALDGIRNFPFPVAKSIRDSAEESDLNISLPMMKFSVRVDPESQRPIFDNPVLTGWRFLLLDQRRVFGAVELSVNGDAGGVRFSRLDDGFLVHNTVKALAWAERLGKFQDADYELRLLEIPEKYFTGLWFAENNKDLFIPLSFRLVPISLFSVITLEELIDQLSDHQDLPRPSPTPGMIRN